LGSAEVKLSNRKFIWANNQENIIMYTIDRIFCSTELGAMFPLATSQAFTRMGSDHTPPSCGIRVLIRAFYIIIFASYITIFYCYLHQSFIIHIFLDDL
jgi:hypothetical protein